MRNTRIKNSRITKLNKGKVKGVGFIEKIGLKIAGFIDGKRGLPRKEETGEWISPHLIREIHAYDEFTSKMFGSLQIEQETSYAHLGELMDSIVNTRMLLAEAEEDLDKAFDEEKNTDISRKYGESKLTDEQVVARRTNEKSKRLAPFQARVCSLQEKLTSETVEFSELRNLIIEEINSTRMICKRVEEHIHQRIAVYYNSALRKHPDNNRMPAAPCVDIVSNAEIVYLNPHRVIMQKAELLSKTISDDKKEVS